MDYLSKKIGIIGGGQLGKMMIQEAKKMGFYCITLDPSENCPSHSISDEHMINAFDDRGAIKSLAEKCDVLTYEFEHIDSEILTILEHSGHKIYPTAESLKIIQNKFTQKTHLASFGIDVGQFRAVSTLADLKCAAEEYGCPFMLKTCTGGYDGKGNALVADESALDDCFELLGGGKIPLMAEKYVPFVMETSVLACRGTKGEIKVYPVGNNKHINSILHETSVPAKISEKARKNAVETADRAMHALGGVGMFCIELFVTADDRVILNEVAPRPHNSGHYTIEACITSQFENHIRAIAGLPLGDTTLLSPVSMINLLGEDGYDGKAYVSGIYDALKIPGVTVHIYGKEMTKPHRKMGHITALSTSVEEASEKARAAYNIIKIKTK